jgi:hypothetical protein
MTKVKEKTQPKNEFILSRGTSNRGKIQSESGVTGIWLSQEREKNRIKSIFLITYS